jgi:hypothetical protein
MTGKSKRPRLQTTAASDLASSATPRHQFTHSSNTSTRTRQIVTSEPSQPPNTSTPSESPLIEMTSPTLDDHISGSGATELDAPAGIELRTKARRYINSVCRITTTSISETCKQITCLQDTPLLTWKEYRGNYLDACLELEGRGRFFRVNTRACTNASCAALLPTASGTMDSNLTRTFRCLDCFGHGMYCQQCIVSLHMLNPLHHIEVRNPVQVLRRN